MSDIHFELRFFDSKEKVGPSAIRTHRNTQTHTHTHTHTHTLTLGWNYFAQELRLDLRKF